MFSDDRFMTLATGLVLAIVVGTIAQKSDTVMAFFGAGDASIAQSDQFTVRAGKNQSLDVAANDSGAGNLVITKAPDCGSARTNDAGGIDFYDSGACSGKVVLTYCVENGDICAETDVDLNVIADRVAVANAAPAEVAQQPAAAAKTASVVAAPVSAVQPSTQTGQRAQVASDEPQVSVAASVESNDRLVPGQILVANETEDTAVVGFGVASAPALFTPDMQELIQPQETVDTLRRSVAGIAPSQISQDQNITTQTSASAPSRAAVSAGVQQNVAPVGTEDGPKVAFAAPTQPRLGAVPMLAPVQQDNALVPGPDVVATLPGNFTAGADATVDDPVSVGETMDKLAALAVADAPYAPEPSNPPQNVDTQSADAGTVHIATADLADSSDIVVEMAAQILLPAPQLKQTLEHEEQTTPEVDALLSDQNFVADLEPSTPPEKAPVEVASLPPAVGTAVPAPTSLAAVAPACDVQLSVSAALGAKVALFVSSPCRANQVVTIAHGGLSYTAYLNAKGTFSGAIPAMTSPAVITASFADGATARSQVQVRDALDFERIAVMWSVPVTINLHAYEKGASNAAGAHVWSGNPRSYRDTLTGGGGFFEAYGDSAIIGGTVANVYSLPTNHLRSQTTVRMDLSIDDSSQYCGRTMTLKTARSQKNTAPVDKIFNLTLPKCSSSTGALVLENFVNAISVARR